jgi:hypothetical protein
MTKGVGTTTTHELVVSLDTLRLAPFSEICEKNGLEQRLKAYYSPVGRDTQKRRTQRPIPRKTIQTGLELQHLLHRYRASGSA